MAAVVVEHRRYEVELDVGAVVRRQRRAHEAAGLGDVAGAGAAAAAQEVVEGGLQFAGAVVGHAPGRMPQRADVQVILQVRSEEHTSELQSLMRISYAVFCLKKKNQRTATED